MMSAARMATLGAAIYMMNLFDLFCTKYLLRIPGMMEVNPLCRWALARPGVLEMYKYAVFPLFLWALFHFRKIPAAKMGICISFGVFLLNTLYQLFLLMVRT